MELAVERTRETTRAALTLKLSVLLFEEPLHLESRLSVQPWHHVAVRIERQRDRAVAEHLLDHLWVNSAL